MTDLMLSKPYTKRLNIRNNLIAYKIVKGDECYVGASFDVAPIMKTNNAAISMSSLNGYTIHGWHIERLGLYKKVFKVYKDNELVFKGYSEDVAKKLFMSESRVTQLCNHNVLADKQWMIKFDGDVDLVRMKV